MAESLDKKYLLVDECKWTTQENGKQLTGELLRKDDAGNAMLPEDVIELMK